MTKLSAFFVRRAPVPSGMESRVEKPLAEWSKTFTQLYSSEKLSQLRTKAPVREFQGTDVQTPKFD